jgi:hypothetical protein
MYFSLSLIFPHLRVDLNTWEWTDGTEMNKDILDLDWVSGQPNNYGGSATFMHQDSLSLEPNKFNDREATYPRYNFVCKIDCSKTSPSWKGPGWYRFTKPAGSIMTEIASTEPR